MDKTNPEELESYLRKYPDGGFVELARARLKKLNNSQQQRGTGGGTEPGSRPGLQEGAPAFSDLTGTVWCAHFLDLSFYFERNGLLRIQPGSRGSRHGQGVWTQTGKLVHFRAEITYAFGNPPETRAYEDDGEIVRNTCATCVGQTWTTIDFPGQLSFPGAGKQSLRLEEGPCREP